MIAFLEAHRAGLFARGHWTNNLIAGVIVGVVALPLAMAFAIASGASPEQGLYTAIVAGFLTSVFGGSRLQISGPTGAFIAILAGITSQHGIVGLQVATLMAGVILVVMGAVRFGSVIKYIPDPVIVGFTTGIGVIIWVGQWKDFFGLKLKQTVASQIEGGLANLRYEATMGLKAEAITGLNPQITSFEVGSFAKAGTAAPHFHEKLIDLLHAFPTVHWPTLSLAALALLILIFSPRFFKRIPGPLIAMVVVTLIQVLFTKAGSPLFSDVATIGSAFGGIPRNLPQFSVPSFTFSDLITLIGPAFTIALLGAIESLLSAVVADGMSGTRHNSNQELIGQGIANIAAPLFGGFAATGAIARTATNIRNGATSPLSGVVHALTLLGIILVFAPLAAYIPLCALAAILFVVAYNMSEIKHFLHLARTAPRADVAILLITFGLTVFADLVIAVNVGVMLASLLFMRSMARSVQVEAQHGASNESAMDEGPDDDLAQAQEKFPDDMLVYSIDGPFFFGAAEKLERTLENIHAHMKTVVLRMGRVPFIDATGTQALIELIDNFARKGTRIVLCEVTPKVLRHLDRAGLAKKVGRDNIHAGLGEFLLQNRLAQQQAQSADGVEK